MQPIKRKFPPEPAPGRVSVPDPGFQTGKSVIKPLTALRFVFAFMIFLFHTDMMVLANKERLIDQDAFKEIYEGFLSGGSVGVSFFFVLSGFVLAYTYQKRVLGREISKRQFWVARVARIYPLYLLTSLLAVPLFWQELFSVRFAVRFLQNILLVQTYFPDWLYLNVPGWSISAEMFFYLLFPFLIGFLFRGQSSVRLLGCLLLLPAGMVLLPKVVPSNLTHYIFYLNPVVRLADFFLGICVFQVYKRIDFKKLSPATLTVLEAASLLLFALFYLFHKQVPPVYRYSAYYWVPMCGIVLIFTNQAGAISRFLSHKLFVYLGELSFGFYLFHVLVAAGFLYINRLFLHIRYASLELPAIFILSLLVSWISYEKIERPANAYLRNKFS